MTPVVSGFVTGLAKASLACALHFPDIQQIWDSPIKAALGCVLLIACLLTFHYRQRLPKPVNMALLAGLMLVSMIAFLQALQLVQLRVRTLPEWDVRVFWIYGQLTAHGENVYAPQSYDRFYKELSPERDFAEAVLRVGATYPPPTMLLFRPLGCCEMPAAFKYWYVFVGVSLLTAIELLRRTFVKQEGLWGAALVLLLVFSLRGTWDTIRFGQTNFLALMLLLLYWQDRKNTRAGVWLALCPVVKVYLAVLLLDALRLKRWRVLICAAVTAVALSIASLILLGPKTWVSYFTLHPTSRLPGWVYVEWVNQSLLATILRMTHASISGMALTSYPLFLTSALTLTIVTAWLVYRLDSTSEWSLPLWLVLALIIYPGTLAHYSVMLLPVLLLIWKEREKTPLGVPGSALVVSLIIGLAGFHSNAFAAYMVAWTVLASLALWTISLEHRSQRVASFSPV